MANKRVESDGKVPLKLTAAERTLLVEEVLCLPTNYETLLRSSEPKQPALFSLDELEDLAGYVAAEANHCENSQKEKKLDRIFEKIQTLLDRHANDEPPTTLNFADARQAEIISKQAVELATWAAQVQHAAEQLDIKSKAVKNIPLDADQRTVLLLLPDVPAKLQTKLGKANARFTIADVVHLTLSVAAALPDAQDLQQVALLMIGTRLSESLQEAMVDAASPSASRKSKSKTASADLFQFKITLLGIEPPIWRRIQVQDCTLDKLHEHIQTAMGWTNSHLHQFNIKGGFYGDPQLLDDGFDDFQFADSTATMISEIIPPKKKQFAFKYEYDFGDGWEHEVLFEGCPPVEKGKKYPLCLEGERACPPEDVGGVWGYQDFLEAIANPKHEEHDNFLEWCGGSFSPDKFDPKKATREMKKGLPDWRMM